jgi:hypothetical protein
MSDFDPSAALWPWLEPVWYLNEEQQESLAPDLRSMIALSWYCIEVANGGSEQFYHNSPGHRPRDPVHALELIGFADGAAAVQRSWIIFSDIDDREQRISDMQGLSIEAMEEHFAECEERLFRAADGGLAGHLRAAMAVLPFFTGGGERRPSG